jgi:hypothetical protein
MAKIPISKKLDTNMEQERPKEEEEEKQTGMALNGLLFVGPTHSVDWQTPSVKLGSEQTLFGTASGLTSSDLSLPNSVRHLTSQTDADHQLTNEDCREMLPLFFSDIYPDAGSFPLPEAKSRYQRRIALERAYFAGKGIAFGTHPCNLRSVGQTKATEAQFKTRAVGSLFAVGTTVPLTPHAIATNKVSSSSSFVFTQGLFLKSLTTQVD